MEELPAIPDNQIDQLIALAIQSGASVDNLERLLSMRRELKAEYAASQYNKAMAAFQVACPIIIKDKPGARTDKGFVAYYYAPLDSIVRQTKQLIAEHGFHYTIDTKPDTDGVHTYCHVNHADGHETVKHVYMPFVERTRVMTNAQVEMATMTIATRRVFCNAFGIVTGEEDTDGRLIEAEKPKGPQPITEETLDILQDMLLGHEDWYPNIYEKFRVTKLEELTEPQALRLRSQLEKLQQKK